ncbi:hypothetical protein NL676_035963 [Syzygium grande]|nr:hypothetical protein NL676_035963 [Syzygium grande]
MLTHLGNASEHQSARVRERVRGASYVRATGNGGTGGGAQQLMAVARPPQHVINERGSVGILGALGALEALDLRRLIGS